jgi:hypothetical protein
VDLVHALPQQEDPAADQDEIAARDFLFGDGNRKQRLGERHHPCKREEQPYARQHRERERLGKLFRQLGTDNLYEAEAARGRIDSLLRQFSKSWSDLVSSLSGRTPTIHPALAADIAGPGDPVADEVSGLLAFQHRSDLRSDCVRQIPVPDPGCFSDHREHRPERDALAVSQATAVQPLHGRWGE